MPHNDVVTSLGDPKFSILATAPWSCFPASLFHSRPKPPRRGDGTCHQPATVFWSYFIPLGSPRPMRTYESHELYFGAQQQLNSTRISLSFKSAQLFLRIKVSDQGIVAPRWLYFITQKHLINIVHKEAWKKCCVHSRKEQFIRRVAQEKR